MTETKNTVDEELQRLRAAHNATTRRIREISAEELEVDKALRTADSEDSRARTQAAREGKAPREAHQRAPELREKARDLPHQRRACELDAANLSVEMATLQEQVAREELSQCREEREQAEEQAAPYIQRRDEARKAESGAASRVQMLRDQRSRYQQRLNEIEE